MTTNPSFKSLNEIADTIIANDELDYIELYEIFRSCMTNDDEIAQLAMMLEICPIHSCAAEICDDDEYALTHSTLDESLAPAAIAQIAELARCRQYRS